MRRTASEPNLTEKHFNFSYFKNKDPNLATERRKLAAYLTVRHQLAKLKDMIKQMKNGIPDMLFETEEFRYYASNLCLFNQIPVFASMMSDKTFVDTMKSISDINCAFQNAMNNKLQHKSMELITTVKDKLQMVIDSQNCFALANKYIHSMLDSNVDALHQYLTKAWNEIMFQSPLTDDYIDYAAGKSWLDKDAMTHYSMQNMSEFLSAIVSCNAHLSLRSLLQKLPPQDRSRLLNKYGPMMLCNAATYHKIDIIKLLLEYDVNVNAKHLVEYAVGQNDSYPGIASCLTPLAYACYRLIITLDADSINPLNIIMQFLENAPKACDDFELLTEGKINDELLTIIKLLIDHGADPNVQIEQYEHFLQDNLRGKPISGSVCDWIEKMEQFEKEHAGKPGLEFTFCRNAESHSVMIKLIDLIKTAATHPTLKM